MNPSVEVAQLERLKIIVDPNNGHLCYANDFLPLQLTYELIFVRHGETYGNCGQTKADGTVCEDAVKNCIKDKDKRIFQGQVDTVINQLTAFGKQQALEAALQLETLPIGTPDVIFHSPLSRALDTALPYVARNGLEDRLKPLTDIRELSFGAWDNRRICDIPEVKAAHLFYEDQNALVKQSGINGNAVYSEGENFCELLIRAYTILISLNTPFKAKKVLFFSHSMFGAACAILLGKGQIIEGGDYLAFDGKKRDGSYYTLPNAQPFILHEKVTKF